MIPIIHAARNFLIVFSFLLVGNFAHGQIIEDKIPQTEFKGVFPLNTIEGVNNGYCVYLERGISFSKRESLLKVYSTELKLLGTISRELSSATMINDFAFDGETLFVSYIVQSLKAKQIFESFNLKGERLGERLIEKVSMNVSGNPIYYPKYTVGKGGETYVVRNTQIKKIGYVVEKLNSDQKLIWQKTFIPEKGELLISKLSCDQNSVYLLESHESWGNNIGNTLIRLSADTGEILYKHNLSDASFTFYPMSFKTDGQNLIAAGMYFRGSKIGWAEPEGIYIQKIAPSGDVIVSHQYTLQEMKPALKMETPGYWFKVKPEIVVHDIHVIDNSYYLMGELYKSDRALYNGFAEDEFKSTRARLLDFVSIEFDHEMELKTISRIERPHMILSISEGNTEEDQLLESKNYLDFFRNLRRLNGFSYRFSDISANHLPLVAFTNAEDYKTAVYCTREPNEELLHMQLEKYEPEWVSDVEKAVDFLDPEVPLFAGIEESGVTEFSATNQKTHGILSATPGKAMVYQYSIFDSTLTMEIKALQNTSHP